MKRILFICVLFLNAFSLNVYATIIQYNAGSGVTQLALAAVSYCLPKKTSFTACNGGIFMTIQPNGQLQIESACANSSAIGAYQVFVPTQASLIEACLKVNGTGIITQSSPNGGVTLSGDFFGNGMNCGTPCG